MAEEVSFTLERLHWNDGLGKKGTGGKMSGDSPAKAGLCTINRHLCEAEEGRGADLSYTDPIYGEGTTHAPRSFWHPCQHV